MCKLFLTPWLFALSLFFLITTTAVNGAPPAVFDLKGNSLWIQAAGQVVPVSLKSPGFALGDSAVTGPALPLSVKENLARDRTWEVSYPPLRLEDAAQIEVKLYLRWSERDSVLRKWARFRLVHASSSRLLKEVVLDRIDPQGGELWTHGGGIHAKGSPVILDGPQSRPVFLPGRFVGVEYPVASTRRDGKQIVLAHRPGRRLEPGVWYETRTAVFGVTSRGGEVRAFQRYIAAHRPKPTGFHVNYNSWWTSPVPYTEGDILGLMNVFQEQLTKAHGAHFDTFTIDMGWSDPKSIWEIDAKQFPAGFGPIRDTARRMHSNLGLWISPSSYYPPALDGNWAKAQGYETTAVRSAGNDPPKVRLLCLGGQRYAERFKERLADLVGRWGIRHLKLDGCNLECSELDHGHEPGVLSSEAIATGLIAAVQAARQADPNVWIETTCFGYNPSPWWLFYVNSVIGTFGDDAPVGRVAAPVYRESYTTARDFFNLQGAALLPVPIGAQEVLGIVHQSPEPFLNDGVLTIMRGHMFLPLYVNPKFMSDARWKTLAELLVWARAHAEILDRTIALLPASWQVGNIPRFADVGVMPREPYGYAHVQGQVGLVALRNPWIAPTSYSLKLSQALGFSPGTSGLSAVSLYPEPRLYGEGLRLDDTLQVELAPYETLVLSINAHQGVSSLPRSASVVRSQIKISQTQSKIERVAFRDAGKALGPDWTCPLGSAASAIRLMLEAKVEVKSPQAELVLLLEGDKPPANSVGRLIINGRPVEPTITSSATGWSATGLPGHEHWTFLRVMLASGANVLSLDQFLGDDCREVSAWVLASKSGSISTFPGMLPQPESISLDGAVVMSPARTGRLPAPAVRIKRPIERIDGVFLDVLTPVSVAQGYGTLQRNQSVWEKPMVIGGKRFPRGLGTHAPSRIVFALDGKYRRFQSWAGADGNTTPTITFEVRVDGIKRWASGLMTRETPAAWIDLDITGARNLELLVGDAGNLASDHADWALARLLR